MPGPWRSEGRIYGRELVVPAASPKDIDCDVCDRVFVAALLHADKDDIQEQLQQHSDLVVHAHARLRFHGQVRRLLVMRLATARFHEAPALQLERLCACVDDSLHRLRPAGCCHAGPTVWTWPLHDSLALRMKLAREEMLGRHASEGSQRLLLWLHMKVPDGGHPFVLQMRDRYGAAIAYAFAYNHVFVKRLWPVTALCVALWASGSGPVKNSRVLWELFKAAIFCWGALFLDDSEAKILPAFVSAASANELGNPAYVPGKRIWPHMLFMATPTVLVFFALVMCVILAQVEFNAWLVFIWGDCVHLLCMDPVRKQGFLGWLGQVGSDITVAILFELLKEIAKGIGSWVATLQNHKLQVDHDRAVLTISVGLEACARVGVFAILAFAFVPQWTPPGGAGPGKDCSDYWGYRLLGESSLGCLQRQLQAEQRQHLFNLSMIGPFVVAPFIEILMKAIVPKVADRLYAWERRAKCRGWAGDFIARFLATIFVYDCESIGCLRFAFWGWPYSDIVVEPFNAASGHEEEEGDTQDLLQQALAQHVLRPFQPLDELLELKLCFLCILFFVPCNPLLAVPLLLARLLDCHTDLAKLLFIERCSRPSSSTLLLHASMQRYVRVVLITSGVWSLGLSFITYNPHLADWMASLGLQS